MSDGPFLQRITDDLADAGLHASIVVRDLLDGRELAIDPGTVWPLASVAKLPLAAAVLLLAEDGLLDLARPVHLSPSVDGVSAGTDRFRQPASIAVEDLLALALTISDNRAADALLALTGIDTVRTRLQRAGIEGFALRHPFQDLGRTPIERFGAGERHLAHTLAIRGRTPAAGHPVPQLDIARTNTGSATALADLLAVIWAEGTLPTPVTERLRALLGDTLVRHRLAPDLASDSTTWSSKTGTLLHLRHEAGVLQHRDGERYAVVVLSRSDVPASTQPAAEAALGAAARALHERLRGRF